MAIKCRNCTRDAPSGCQRTLCFGCCSQQPKGVCGETVHNQRNGKRGCEGKKRRQFHTASWHEANELQKLFYEGDRAESLCRNMKMKPNQFQNVILQGLRLLAAHPDMDLWDDRSLTFCSYACDLTSSRKSLVSFGH